MNRLSSRELKNYLDRANREQRVMAKAITIPRLGLTMEKATITTWMKEEGDAVDKGDVLCIIETDKVSFEIEAPQPGVLVKVMTEAGTVVPVGEVIAVIAQTDETFDLEDLIRQAREETRISRSGESVRAAPKTTAVESPPRVKREKREIRISPLAKRIAQEKGVSFEGITGTGPGGSITKEDVLKAFEARGKVSVQGSPLLVSKKAPLEGIKKVVAERMSSSWHTAPRVTQIMEVDMTEVVRFREENRSYWEASGVGVSLNDILIRVVSRVLMEYPEINSSLKGDEIEIYGNVNMGIAVATERGLIVPVLRNAHQKSLVDISRESSSLIEKTQHGKIGPDELRFGTFTITNLGTFGIDFFTPIINQPESAILGVGKLDRKVKVVEGDKIAIRSVMNLCLAFDHRVIDGVPAALFLGRVKEVLESSNQIRELT
jgi:pyruvate dehydrogenase E2 component (dihydrolipoamide acetyltransferase)